MTAMTKAPLFAVWMMLAAILGCNHEPPLPGTASERLVVLLEDPPRNLDPRFTSDSTSMRVSRLVFSSLVTVDNPSLSPEAQLAASWEVDSKRPSRWVVRLRTGVHWHDGTPFTATDVVYTFQSVMDPDVGSPFREPYQANIASVRALDKHTVEFILHRPYATFVTDLVLGIVPRHLCESYDHRFKDGHYVGTGPFMFVARHGERRMDLKAFSEYMDTPATVPHIVLRTIRDEGTRLMALLGGSADLMQNGVSPVLMSVLAREPSLKVHSVPSIAFTYVALNLRHPALKDRRVRQALAYAIDRKRIIDTYMGGRATSSTGMLAPFHWAYEEKTKQYDYDPKRARSLLAKAGYGPGQKPLKITIKISTHRFRRTVARAITQAWRTIGVDADVRAFEFGTFFSDIKQGNFEAYLLDLPEPIEPDMYRWMLHGLGTPHKTPTGDQSPYAAYDRRFLSPGALEPSVLEDPQCQNWPFLALTDATRNWVMRAFSEKPPYYTANRMFYANPAVDCRVDLGRRVTQRAKRIPYYKAVQGIVAVDLPVIPLWHPDLRVVTSTRIDGFKALPNLRLSGLVDTRLIQ